MASNNWVGDVRLEPGEGQVRVLINDQEFTRYCFGPETAKPYLGPIAGPFGHPITRLDLKEKEHPHQRSLWIAHGDVNGVDVWNEPAGRHGKEVHQGFTHFASGLETGRFTARTLWTDFAGNPLLTDERAFVFHSTPPAARLMDIRLTLQADHRPVTLGATKEAGPLGVRVHPQMTGQKGGRITNGAGGQGEKECWGKRAPWCDYSGEVEGETVGIAIFDAPGNPDHPTHWHVREYGLMAPNNFHFLGPRHLAVGKRLTWHYRVFIHAGDAASARVADAYRAFATEVETGRSG